LAPQANGIVYLHYIDGEGHMIVLTTRKKETALAGREKAL